jgi:G3E family GTPase
MTLPLTVIGGYLGAGKTTLLNHMLSGDHGRRLAVIVNEFGAINVDASLIADHDGDTVALTNGCVCCSALDGTTEAIARFLRTPDAFDHIVIEASGVAEPGKVARNTSGFRLPLDGVIVMADAEQLPDQAANRYAGRSVLAQLRQADLIVLNKLDLASEQRLTETRALISAHAPGTPVIETRHADLPVSVLFGAHQTENGRIDDAMPDTVEDHATAYHSDLREYADPLGAAELKALAASLTEGAIRAKGHVWLADDPETRHLYQQVGRRWTLTATGPWPTQERATRIVSIRLSAEPGPRPTTDAKAPHE